MHIPLRHFPRWLSHRWVAPALISGLTILLYGHIVGYDFAGLDNDILITKNPIAHNLSWANIKAAFTSYDPELYIPLTFLSYQINWSIAGLSPWIYHLTDLMLHAVNAVLVFVFVMNLTERRMAGIIAGLLFAVHPLHTEAVAWPAARKDLLMAFFCLCSLIGFLRWRESGEPRWYQWSFLAFFLSLLAKVTSIVLPGVLLLLLLRERISWKKIMTILAPFVLLSVFFGIIAIVGKTRIIEASPPITTFLLSLKSTAFYLGQLIAPWRLSPLYPQNTPVTPASGEFLFSILVVAVLLGLFAWTFRRAWMASFAIAFFLLLLAPNFLNFFKNGFLFFGSDRYAYLASIGPFLLIGSSIDTLMRRGPARAIVLSVFAVWLLFLIGIAHVQVRLWRDDETLYRGVIARAPVNPIAWNNLGVVLMDRGDLTEALPLFDQAAAQDPYYVIPFVNKGHIYRRLRRDAEAVRAYEEGIAHITPIGRLRPYDLLPYRALADYYHDTGRGDLALLTEQRAATRVEQSR